MRDDRIDHVRHFNRTVAQRIGALSDNFLARHRPMAEARLLWEIGARGCEVRTLRNRLGLDSGHASRLLRALDFAPWRGAGRGVAEARVESSLHH